MMLLSISRSQIAISLQALTTLMSSEIADAPAYVVSFNSSLRMPDQKDFVRPPSRRKEAELVILFNPEP
jgi:hypothetical protein